MPRYLFRVQPGGRRVKEAPEELPAAPAGTAADILAAVGTNANLARAALRVERTSDKPRKTLIAALERISE